MTALGAVACGHPVTAAAAAEILEDGGNAFDAIIAAQFAACVAEPVLTSLGGGGFLLARAAGDAPILLDFFTHTPRSRPGREEAMFPIEADFGTATQTFHVGAASIATPGTVAGMFTAHARLATMPMSRLVAPAVAAARQGVQVNDFQGYIFDVVRPIYRNRPPYDGAETGARLIQPDLADTLDALAGEGARLFYEGELATAMVDFCAAEGGHLIHADLAAYRVFDRAPLAFDHRGWRVITNPPPSAGGVLIRHSLESLTGTPVSPQDFASALADTATVRDTLLAGTDQVQRGTTHISVIDGHGNLAAMTLSNGEGSGCVIPGTGIMLNNMLGEEDINPAGIGAWREDQRLGSMMAPTLLIREGCCHALGSGGSNRIRSALVQTIARLIHNQESPEQAVAAPRLHLEDGLLSFEPGFDEDTVARLSAYSRGLQVWEDRNLFFGGVHLAGQLPDGSFTAVGDPRRGGVGTLARQP